MTTSADLFSRDILIIHAPGPDTYTTPSLTANLVMRVFLGLLANLVCLIPLRHLYRNGEFAAVVFIVNIEIKNFDTIINALLWHDDNTHSWWPGYGLCDVSPYIRNFTVGLFVTCLLAIMRNLAQQVGLLRVNPLTVREKRRRNLTQAFIMFPLPLIQMAWLWPLTGQRFVVGTLVGCSWISYPTWPYVVFFVIAPIIVALITAGYAVLTYIRFREVAKTTRTAHSTNRVAAQRAQRTKRRLYLMVLSILIPFLPLVITLAVINLIDSTPLKPFDYDAIHNRGFPFPWNSIIFLPSNNFGFAYMNICYIAILSAVPIFVFFGMTKDAMNSYRHGLLLLGFGCCFPGLHQEYDPDRNAYGDNSYGSRLMGSVSSTTTGGKLRSFLSSRQMSTASVPVVDPQPPQLQSFNFSTHTSDAEEGRGRHDHHITPHPAPQPHPLSQEITSADLPHRNPFLFRTNLDFPIPFRLPFFSKLHPKPTQPSSHQDRPLPLHSLPSIHHPHWDHQHSHNRQPSRVSTRVWSEDEVGLFTDSPPHGRASPDFATSVLVETELMRQTHRR